MTLHHWERDEGLLAFVCTPAPATAWRGITCNVGRYDGPPGRAGCGLIVIYRTLCEVGCDGVTAVVRRHRLGALDSSRAVWYQFSLASTRWPARL